MCSCADNEQILNSLMSITIITFNIMRLHLQECYCLATEMASLHDLMFEKISPLTDGRLSHGRGEYTAGIILGKFLRYTFFPALFADGRPFSWTKEDVNHLYSANILMSSDGTLLHIFEY